MGPTKRPTRATPPPRSPLLERIDRELLAPLAAAVRATAATLTVCPDHGCDPASGEHDGAPVPCLTWPGTTRTAGGRLTERDVVNLAVTPLAGQREAA